MDAIIQGAIALVLGTLILAGVGWAGKSVWPYVKTQHDTVKRQSERIEQLETDLLALSETRETVDGALDTRLRAVEAKVRELERAVHHDLGALGEAV